MTDPDIPPPAIETLIAQLHATCVAPYDVMACWKRPQGYARCLGCQAADALTASATRLRELEQEKTPPLIAYMNAETTPERDVAYLRLYAVKVRDQTERTWEIPNTRAATLEDIANRAEASHTRLQQLEQERKQQPTPVLDSLHAVMTNHGIASRASEYESLITELVQWAAKACRQSQDTRFRQSQLEYDEAVHVNRMLIDGVTDATVDAFLEKQQTYQQRAEHAEAHLQQLQEAQTQIRELASQALDASPDTMDDSKAHE